MYLDKKWKIEGLSPSLPFCEAAKIVLRQRISELVSSIKTYFENNTPENLHDIRISLRRLRYTMEIFHDCINTKKFDSLYKKVKTLQDLSGLIRDIDVMKENLQLLSEEEKVKFPQKLKVKIESKNLLYTEQFKLALMKFYHSKSLRKFI